MLLLALLSILILVPFEAHARGRNGKVVFWHPPDPNVATPSEKQFVSAMEELPDVEEPPTPAEHLRMSPERYAILERRELRLRENIRRVSERGGAGLKRVLVNDHLAWAREFLTRPQYEIYRYDLVRSLSISNGAN